MTTPFTRAAKGIAIAGGIAIATFVLGAAALWSFFYIVQCLR